MPLVDAEPGPMDCTHCTDASVQLEPFEAVRAGTASDFAQSGELDPEQAEQAAREHLARQPAWMAL